MEIRDPDGRAAAAPASRARSGSAASRWPASTSAAAPLDADGWFPTNDGGCLDDDGFLFVEGRLDDVIVRGGENMSPGEIEDVLLAHPAVADAGVVGIPDDEWGEAVAAAVVLERRRRRRRRPRSCRTGSGAGSARPSTPTVIASVAELPYNETGKLLRRVLRTELTQPPAAG